MKYPTRRLSLPDTESKGGLKAQILSRGSKADFINIVDEISREISTDLEFQGGMIGMEKQNSQGGQSGARSQGEADSRTLCRLPARK